MTDAGVPADPAFVAARRGLLDTLEVLSPFHSALILIGAQAVYLRTGTADLPVAPYTTDADIAIDPRVLAPDSGSISAALEAAGFEIPSGANPGQWQKAGVPDAPIDLMVPAMLAGQGGRRSVRIAGQENSFARRTDGLEAAVIDHDTMAIPPLAPGDRRSMRLAVAGPVALLLAKTTKLDERFTQGRVVPKDALDVLRLLQSTRVHELVRRLRRTFEDTELGPSIRTHAARFVKLFGATGQGRRLLLEETSKLNISREAVAGFVDRGVAAVGDALT